MFGGQRTRLASARSRARLSAKRVAWLIAEASVASFGFWELDNPKTLSQLKQGFGNYQVTARQTQSFWNLYFDNLHLSRLNPGNLLGAGRGQKVLNSLIDMFEKRHCKQMDVQSVLNSALPVDPERMSLPRKAALIDPCDILPEEHARVFRNRHLLVDPDLDKSFDIPKPCYLVSKSVEAAVRVRLLHSGMARLMPLDQALRKPDGKPLL